ncbi:hypothetical protein RFI_35943, partial [Reticulomyxa filosa]
KLKECKYRGLANHEAAKCRNKDDPRKHLDVAYDKGHICDSVKCEVIRKAREKFAKNYSYTDAAKSQRLNDNENNNGPRKSNKRKKNKRKINNDQKQQNKKSDADEILSLKRELAEMKSAFNPYFNQLIQH